MSHPTFNKTEHISSDDIVIVFTDLESDDAIALLILANSDIVPHAVIVGEGADPAVRLARGERIVETLWPTHDIDVLVGQCNPKKPFPGEGRAEKLLHSEVSSTDVEGATAWCLNYLEDLLQSLGGEPAVQFISLKPPRELFAMWRQGGHIFENCTLHAYGSFNFRCVIDQDLRLGGDNHVETDINEMSTADRKALFGEFINKGFKRVNIFETYAAMGQTNTINPDKNPTFFKTWNGKRRLPGFKLVEGIMEDWDTYIMKDCEESVRKHISICYPMHGITDDDVARVPLEHQEYVKRNLKCWRQVRENLGRQFVAADPGCIVWAIGGLTHSKDFEEKCRRGKYACDDNLYTTLQESDDPDARVFMCNNIGFEAVKCAIQDALFQDGLKRRARHFTKNKIKV